MAFRNKTNHCLNPKPRRILWAARAANSAEQKLKAFQAIRIKGEANMNELLVGMRLRGHNILEGGELKGNRIGLVLQPTFHGMLLNREGGETTR